MTEKIFKYSQETDKLEDELMKFVYSEEQHA